jgi:hypothetical protein
VTTPTPDRLTEALGNNKGPDYAAAARACSILDEAVLSGALTAAERRLVHPYVGPDEFAPSALADRPEPGELDAHPDEPHEFRTTCLRCGEPGMLHVSLITPDETVTIARLAAESGEGADSTEGHEEGPEGDDNTRLRAGR